MERLLEISKKYENLKSESSKEQDIYFSNHNTTDLLNDITKKNLPKYKQLEIECRNKEIEFVKQAKRLRDESGITNKELVKQISSKVLQNSNGISHYLLIKLMWELHEIFNSFCVTTLEKTIRSILKTKKIGYKEEYFLESYIEIWNKDTNQLIPIDILEPIILMEYEESELCYHAMIKAVNYLYEHPATEVEKIITKAKKTKKYREDEYYREWID